MLNNVPVKQMKHGDLTIEGYSRAAVQSYWRIAELKLGFDLGAHPWDFMGTPTWLLSHCHLDHVAALPLYVARRRLMKMTEPRIYVPHSTVQNVRSMLDSFERLDRGRLPCQLIGVEHEKEYELSRELVFQALQTVHRVQSFGFVIFERRRKLKPEFTDLTGEEIKNLRKNGTEVTHEVRIPLIAYTGDTAPKGLDNNPLFYKAKILITEMTFIADDHRRHLIHKNGHMHLDDFIERADKFENELIIASHFSTRYGRHEAEKIVKKRVPDMLDGRFENLVVELMDEFSSYRPQLAPRSLYVHIPFCRHRCGYCNFALVADRDYLVDRYLDALQKELSFLDKRFELDTFFLGGGTPTHLNAAQLTRLFELVDGHFDFSDAEVTTEANPSDLNSEKISLLTQLGVNRFSLGVQSFRAEKLKLLERDHNAQIIRQVVEGIRQHVDDFSLDLIFAATGETREQWQADIESAIELRPTHLSTYELTIEKGTQFWNRNAAGELPIVDEDLRAEMYEQTIDCLAASDYQQYEISSFSTQGNRCEHNLIYWSGDPYFAFGAGASRYIDGVRETNHGSVTTYIKRLESNESPISQTEKLNELDRMKELLIVGLRRIDGVNWQELENRIGAKPIEQLQNFEQLQTSFGTLAEAKLIELSYYDETLQQIHLTRKGLLLYDSVAEIILR